VSGLMENKVQHLKALVQVRSAAAPTACCVCTNAALLLEVYVVGDT